MIPIELRALCEKQPGEIHREDREKAVQEMQDLGIPLDSEFGQILLEYCLINFHSDVSYEYLCDIAEPTDQIRGGTEFVWEVWGLPRHFICFTSCQGEGCYLYDVNTGYVWDFELATREEFLAGRYEPMSESFFDFLTWYLGPTIH